jgi:hypothetical protein
MSIDNSGRQKEIKTLNPKLEREGNQKKRRKAKNI